MSARIDSGCDSQCGTQYRFEYQMGRQCFGRLRVPALAASPPAHRPLFPNVDRPPPRLSDDSP